MRHHRRTAARSPHVVPPPVRRARAAASGADAVAPPPHTLQPPSPSWLATAIFLAPSIVTTELPSFPFEDPSPQAFSSLRLPQMKTTFAKRPQSQSSRMTKRHSHAIDRNRTDHGRPSHVAQYGIVIINGIDATAKQHDERRWGGGGKATGLTGLRGGVARQPELAGLRGRQGGGGKTELTRKPELTGWRGGSALETVMNFSIFRHISPKAQCRTRVSLSRTPFRYNTAKNSPVSYRRKLKIGIASLFR